MFQTDIGKTIIEVSHKRIERPAQSVYFNHIHNHCEMLLFISGEADYNIDGKIYSPRPYDLLFIPAATYHYLVPTASTPYENYVIGIDPAEISKEHYEKLFSPPLVINIKDEPELKAFFARLDTYNKSFSKSDFDLCAKALIDELIVYCSYQKRRLETAGEKSAGLVESITQYISEHLEEKLDADAIARHFLLSKSYVQNIFSQDMHIGLKKYIMQKKIYAAHADMLRGMSPYETCEKYRFGDYSVFYRTYKKTFDTSPRNIN